LSFSVKYEALITVMEYLREHCSICWRGWNKASMNSHATSK
jgi:hypothetical protein